MAIVGNSKQSIETIKNTISLINNNLSILKEKNSEQISDDYKAQYKKNIISYKEFIERYNSILELYSADNISTLINGDFLNDLFLSISINLIKYNDQLEKIMQNTTSMAFSSNYDLCINYLDLINKDMLHLLFLSNARILKASDGLIESTTYLEQNFNLFQKRIEKIQTDLSQKEDDTTEYLNRQGLCKSFNDRSVILKKESNVWLCILVLIIIGLTAFWGLYLYNDYHSITPENIDFIIKKHFLFLPLSIIVFWFLWITTKKHLYYSRLADDYNYKNDISMAYYGYKNEILPEGNENDALRLKLLDNVLAIITKNPVESSMKTDTSPYTEIISKLLDQVKKQK